MLLPRVERRKKVKVIVWLFVTPWTIQSMEFFRPRPSPGDLPNPGIEPRFSTLQADSLIAEPQGKPKNTRVGSLSLLQWIFLTEESNQGLLHCRQILYQLGYPGRTLLNRGRVGRQRGYWFSSMTSLTISITYHYDTNKHPCWLWLKSRRNKCYLSLLYFWN